MKPNRPALQQAKNMGTARELVHASKVSYKELAKRLRTTTTDIRMACRTNRAIARGEK